MQAGWCTQQCVSVFCISQTSPPSSFSITVLRMCSCLKIYILKFFGYRYTLLNWPLHHSSLGASFSTSSFDKQCCLLTWACPFVLCKVKSFTVSISHGRVDRFIHLLTSSSFVIHRPYIHVQPLYSQSCTIVLLLYLYYRPSQVLVLACLNDQYCFINRSLRSVHLVHSMVSTRMTLVVHLHNKPC